MAHRTKTQFATDITTYIKSAGSPSLTTGADVRTLLPLLPDSVMWGGTTMADWHTSGGVGTGGFGLSNPAGTFKTTLLGGAVTADRTLNLPAITGADTLMSLGLAQDVTAAKNFRSGTFRLYNTANAYYSTILNNATANSVWFLPSGSSGFILTTTSEDTSNQQRITGPKTWADATILLENTAGTYKTTLRGGAQTGNYNLSIPVLSADDTIMTLGTVDQLPYGTNAPVRVDYVIGYAQAMQDGGIQELTAFDTAQTLLEPGYAITHVLAYTTEAFAGGASASVTLSVGTSAPYDQVMSGYDLSITPSGSNFYFAQVGYLASMTGPASVIVNINNIGEDLTSGSLQLSFWVTKAIA